MARRSHALSHQDGDLDPMDPFLSDIVSGEAVQVTPNGSSFGGNFVNENALYGFRGGQKQQGAMNMPGVGDLEIEHDRQIYGGNRSGE